jgi:hypothetical protein
MRGTRRQVGAGVAAIQAQALLQQADGLFSDGQTVDSKRRR